MVQAGQGSRKSNTSRSRRKPVQVKKKCLRCRDPYKGSAQSKYCSKYCTECASRERKEALIEAFAHFLHAYGADLMQARFGVLMEIDWVQALAKAGQCIKTHYEAIRLKMELLGYQYHEADRMWRQTRLLQAG